GGFHQRGNRRVSFRSRAGPRGDRAARRRQEVRALLELFHARGRECALSRHLRALQRSHRRNRGGQMKGSKGCKGYEGSKGEEGTYLRVSSFTSFTSFTFIFLPASGTITS